MERRVQGNLLARCEAGENDKPLQCFCTGGASTYRYGKSRPVVGYKAVVDTNIRVDNEDVSSQAITQKRHKVKGQKTAFTKRASNAIMISSRVERKDGGSYAL